MAENKHIRGELEQMRSLPLDMKITMTKTRIKDWYDHWNGDVYVSFSGGKDSTVLLDLVRQLNSNIPAVFVDTGLEYPEVREFARSVDNLTILRPEMNFKKVIETYGYPIPSKEQANKISSAKRGVPWAQKTVDYSIPYNGYRVSKKWLKLMNAPFKVSSKCCDVMKKKPAHKYEKETGFKPYLGTMTEESALRRQAWLKNGCNAFEAARPSSQPLSFWTNNDILQYIRENNLKIASVYGDVIETGKEIETINGKVPELKTTGCDRTGCVFCMFGIGREKCPNRFQRLKETHPKLYDYCMKPTEEGGLGIKEVLEYCDIPY